MSGKTKKKTKTINDFNGKFSATLCIDFSKPLKKIGKLDNEMATPDTKIKEMSLDVRVYDENDDDYVEPSEEELNEVYLKAKSITIKLDPYYHRDKKKLIIKHMAPNGKHFTAQDLLDVVLASEKEFRPQTEWFGGIDCHHVYFEGFDKERDGSYSMLWGS